MNKTVTEFKAFFDKNKIKGLHKWVQTYSWQERDVLIKHIKDELSSVATNDYSKLDDFKRRIEERNELGLIVSTGFTHYSLIQQTIIHLIIEDSIGVLNLRGTQIKIELLNDEAVDEIILFYNLKNPQKRYKEIKTAINSPSSFLTYIPYSIINGLYKIDRVPFDRQLFVACLIRYNVWHGAQYKKELPVEAINKFDTFFPQDDFTLDILMAVFEMELKVNSAYYLEPDFNIGGVILTLIKKGKLTRTLIQQKIFEAFNNPLLKNSTQSWMKNLYNDLDLSLDEEIACQEQIIGLLLNDVNLVSTNSIQLIKKMVVSPKFDWQLLIGSLEGIVYREKINGALKTLLSILLKKVKKDSKFLEQTCINLAGIFLQTDAKVQLAAHKIYQLLPVPNPKVKEVLTPFIDTMHTEIKKDLVSLLEQEKSVVVIENYKQNKYQYKALSNKGDLEYIKTADDFVFLTSKVLKSKDFEDYELFLEGLVRFYHIKETHLKALKPALKQAERILDGFVDARIGVHHRIVALLITTWLKPDYLSIEGHFEYWKNELKKEKGYVYISNEWLTQFKQFSRERILAFELKENTKILPFLSIPTHKNGQLHPKVFFERLEQYELGKQTPNQGDFDLALARLNRWTKSETQTITSEYRKIVSYLFDKKAVFNPKDIKELENSWLVAFALKNPNDGIQAVLKHRNQIKKWWENTEWSWSFAVDDNNKWVHLNLGIDFIKGNSLQDNGFQKITPNDNHFSSYLDIVPYFVVDISHWFARNPFYAEFIYLKSIQKDFRWLNYFEADKTRSVLATVIQSAKNPVPINKAGYLFLVMSLFSKDNSVRVATLDWLLQLIENKDLDLDEFTNTVTKLVSNKYEHFIPIPRVCEQFEQLLQLEGIYLDVLEKTLENLLPKMDGTNLPRGFSKILQYYFEVISTTLKPISKEVKLALEDLKQVNAVKKIIKKLILN